MYALYAVLILSKFSELKEAIMNAYSEMLTRHKDQSNLIRSKVTRKILIKSLNEKKKNLKKKFNAK